MNSQPIIGVSNGQTATHAQPGGPNTSHARSPSRDRPPIPPAKDFTMNDAFSPTSIAQQPVKSPASLSPPIGSSSPKEAPRRRSFGFLTSTRKTSYSQDEQSSIPEVVTPSSDNNSPLSPTLAKDSDVKSSPSLTSNDQLQKGKTSVWTLGKRYTNDDLWAATGANERDKIERLLKAGLNVDHCQWHTGSIASLVDRAIMSRRPEVLALLLRFQPDLTGSVKAHYIQDQERQYGDKWYSKFTTTLFEKGEPSTWIGALHLASKLGHVDMVRQLLKDGKADPNGMDSKTRTPLFHAVSSGSTKVLELLLDHGAQIEWTNQINVTPLQASVIRGDLDMVKALVKRGALLDKFDSYGETAVYDAAARGHLEIIEHLAEAGADLDIKNDLGITAYFKAASKLDTKVMKALADQGADLDARDRNGCSALMRAAAAGNKPLASLLLLHGLDIDAVDSDGWSALDVAMIKRDEEMAALLLQNGASLQAVDAMGNTPLHRAAARGASTVTRYLLGVKHLDPNAVKNSAGETPLHLASARCKGPVTHLLLHYGADPNLSDHNGLTPLHHALIHGCIAIVRDLCKHSADLGDAHSVAQLLMSLDSAPDVNANLQARQKLIVRILQDKGMAIEWPTTLPSKSQTGGIPILNLPTVSGASIWEDEPARLQIKRGISKPKSSTVTSAPTPAKPKPTVNSRGNLVPSAATTAATVSGVDNRTASTSGSTATISEETSKDKASEDPFETCIPKPPSPQQIIERYIIEQRGGRSGAIDALEGASAALGIANNIASLF